MEITVDLQNTNNSDIKQAIIDKIYTLNREDLEKLVSGDEFNQIIHDITKEVIQGVLFNTEYNNISRNYNESFESFHLRQREEKLIAEVNKVKKGIIIDTVKEKVNSIIENDIGWDNFSNLLYTIMPEATLGAIHDIISENLDTVADKANQKNLDTIKRMIDKNNNKVEAVKNEADTTKDIVLSILNHKDQF